MCLHVCVFIPNLFAQLVAEEQPCCAIESREPKRWWCSLANHFPHHFPHPHNDDNSIIAAFPLGCVAWVGSPKSTARTATPPCTRRWSTAVGCRWRKMWKTHRRHGRSSLWWWWSKRKEGNSRIEQPQKTLQHYANWGFLNWRAFFRLSLLRSLSSAPTHFGANSNRQKISKKYMAFFIKNSPLTIYAAIPSWPKKVRKV